MSDNDPLTIANALVAANRDGPEETREMVKAHYAPDAVSVESVAPPHGARETHGIDGILGKHDWFDAAFEVHSSTCDGPYQHGDDRFAVIFEVDATARETSERSPMKEVAIYTVAGGKIVREEFYYAT